MATDTRELIQQWYRRLMSFSTRQILWHLRVVLRTRDMRQRRASVVAIRNAMGRHIVTVTCDGLKFRLDLRDEGVAQTIYRDRSYEPLETTFIKTRLKPGDVVVDIGANIGYYSINAARVVGPDGRVIAIEAEPYNFELLRHNIALNAVGSNIQALHVALGREKTTARIYRSNSNFGDHRLYNNTDGTRPSIEVPVERLDNILTNLKIAGVDFIKMDVQGFEDHVAYGMSGMFEAKIHPTILTEFWPWGIRAAGGSPEHLLGVLATAGYRLYELSSNGLKYLEYDAVWSRIPTLDPSQPDFSALNLVFSCDRLET